MAKSPSEYSKMFPTFWSGKTGKALRGDAEAQVIQHYLIDNQHTNMWGLYHLPKAYITIDTGHSVKVVNRVFKKLAELGFSYYDEESEYVFVVEMAHMQVGVLRNGDKRIGSANRFYRDIHDISFLGMFYDRYAEELAIAEDRRGLEGASKGLARGSEGPPKPHGRDYADDDDDADASASGSNLEEKKIEAVVVKAFNSDPQNVVNLWNETVVQWGIPEATPLTPGVRTKVREALKYLKTKEQWLAVFAEIPISPFLMGRTGERPFTPTLKWVVGHKTGDPTENYYKMLQGDYRDKNISGMDQLTRRNLEAAERALINMGIPTKAQTFMLREIGDGHTGENGRNSAPRENGDSLWTDAEYREDSDLPGETGGLYGRAGTVSDRLGDEEYEPLSDDRRFEDPD